MVRRFGFWIAVAVIASGGLAAFPVSSLAGFEGSKYVARGKCGPFARAQVKTPSWACVGLVAGPKRGFSWPRSILRVSKNQFVITDMVAWSARSRGKLHLMEVSETGKVTVSVLFDDLNLPHGLARGPDGWIYVGDQNRIWRFSMDDPAGSAQTVLGGLPGKGVRSSRFINVRDNWHPLSHIVFDLDGNLLVNIGAPRDHCAMERGRAPQYPLPCPWAEGENPQAAVWKLSFTWPAGGPGQPGTFEPMARGLRNTMAIAVHPRSGLVVQGENNIDLWNGKRDPFRPPEEINVLEAGGHYGWPYCSGNGEIVRKYRRKGVRSCKRYKPPEILMPAHSAPLGMTYYYGASFPKLRGKLLVALHGRGKWGRRIVAYDTDDDGRPIAPKRRARGRPGLPLAIVDGWKRRRGVRPTGRPVGLEVGDDGSIWFVDDKAKTVMVLLRAERGTGGGTGNRKPRDDSNDEVVAKALDPPAGWKILYDEVLRGRCARCHGPFQRSDSVAAWRELIALDFVDPGNVGNSPMFQMMLGEGQGRNMPPPAGLAEFPDDIERLRVFLKSLRAQ